MKVIIPALLALSAPSVFARVVKYDEGDPLPQTSRVTAFVINDKGEPSVECWEISMMDSSMNVQRKDGSKAAARLTTLVDTSRSSDLEGVDILTWPSVSPIWPPPTDMNARDGQVDAEFFDLSSIGNLFNVQNGLVALRALSLNVAAADDDDDVETHIFSLENGDDWFYFEDSYTGSARAQMADAAPPPFAISTVSGSETELLRLRYKTQPKHKVLHKGGCSFTGISTPSEGSSKRKLRNQNAFVKQGGIVEL